MQVLETELPGVRLVSPEVHRDGRGVFQESWQRRRYADAGIGPDFVQDNLSTSSRGTLRGLHWQHPIGQGKLVFVLSGRIFDVAVDIRRGSSFLGRWVGRMLTGRSSEQLWIPDGFAHGFVVLSASATVMYKCTEEFYPDQQHALLWSDLDIGVSWPMMPTTLSARDASAPRLADVPVDHLPAYSR